MTAIRRISAIALSLAGLAALASLPLSGGVMAQSATAALVAKPVSLPDMAIGPVKAPVSITEYSSMSCPHCAGFEQNVFPMLKSKYIDTGKVHFVFREFPLDLTAASASMLARCIANGDAGKYFGAVDMLFKQQDLLVIQTQETLRSIGKQNGMTDQSVEACLKDQAMLDKLAADQKFAVDVLKVDATPTFFINGEKVKGTMPFEEMDSKLKSLLKK